MVVLIAQQVVLLPRMARFGWFIRSTLLGYKNQPVGLVETPCWVGRNTLVWIMSPDLRRLQQVVVLLSDKVVLLSDIQVVSVVSGHNSADLIYIYILFFFFSYF